MAELLTRLLEEAGNEVHIDTVAATEAGHRDQVIAQLEANLESSPGGFPAMTGNVPFLMKDVVLLALSVYLLRQDLVR